MNETIIIKNWSEINVNPSRNKQKVICPNCHERRSNKRDRALSVNIGEGVAHCHYCDVSYVIGNNDSSETTHYKNESYKMEKKYIKPVWKNKTELSEKVVRYFESRGIKQQTLVDMKITEGMEWMPQHQKEMNTIQFNYFEGGTLVNVKYRSGGKDFKFTSNAELIPYNINVVKGAERIYITEGEMDAITLVQEGYPAISVPNGASDNTSYLDRFMEPYFDSIKEIVIAVDTDDKGIILRDALVRRFGAERCKVVNYWGKDCKDANECAVKLSTHFLKECLNRADFVPVSGIFTVSDFENDLDALYENGLQKGVTIGHKDFDELCSFETRRLCIVTGIPGSGKSEFLDEIAKCLNLRYGWKFGYFSPENFPLNLHASKLVSKITGKTFSKKYLPYQEYKQVKEYMDENFFFICPETEYTLDTILEKAKFLVRRYGVRGVVIDPWNRIEHRIPKGQSETDYISKALDQITSFAQREDVLVFLMAHPTKLKKAQGSAEYEAPTLYDVAGSANFNNKADYGISVHRRKTLGYVEIHVQKVKFRHLGTTGMAKLKYNLINSRYVDHFDDDVPAIWDNDNHLQKMLSDKQKEDTQSRIEYETHPIDLPKFTEERSDLPF